jgi:hypothetical protein
MIITVSRIFNFQPHQTNIATVSDIINIIVSMVYIMIKTFPNVNKRTTIANNIDSINDVYVPRITSRIKS